MWGNRQNNTKQMATFSESINLFCPVVNPQFEYMPVYWFAWFHNKFHNPWICAVDEGGWGEEVATLNGMHLIDSNPQPLPERLGVILCGISSIVYIEACWWHKGTNLLSELMTKLFEW